MTDHTVWTLARMAGCADPDSDDSPGAKWLRGVADAAADIEGAPDDLHEYADEEGAISTYTRWQGFTDLAAWQEDADAFGPIEDMTDGAGVALYGIAQRLLSALIAEREEVAQ